MSSPQRVHAGTPLIFTSGEYSDYGIRDKAIALRTFVLDEVAVEFKRDWERQGPGRGTLHMAFLDWLRLRGFIGDHGITQIHLGETAFDPKVWA